MIIKKKKKEVTHRKAKQKTRASGVGAGKKKKLRQVAFDLYHVQYVFLSLFFFLSSLSLLSPFTFFVCVSRSSPSERGDVTAVCNTQTAVKNG